MSSSIVLNPSGERQVLELNSGRAFYEERFGDISLFRVYMKAKNASETFTSVMRALLEKKARLLSGFHTISKDKDVILINTFLDISDSNIKAKDLARELESLEGVLEVNVYDETFDEGMANGLHFPPIVLDDRDLTLEVETLGNALKRLYEKFGTMAAVILYNMGRTIGESRAESVINKNHMDELSALKLILADRSAKGWCLAEVKEFDSRSATLVVNELFECMPFEVKRDKAVSQFFRGYLAGIFSQLFKKDVSVTETECIAKGGSACRFIVQVRE